MKRTMLAAFLALAITPAYAAERRYTVTDFDRVEMDGPFQVTLGTGRSGYALASGSAQALDRVSIEVQGRTLRVRPNRSAWGGYPGEGAGPVAITLGTHNLRGAAVGGSGSLSIDKARGLKFDLTLSGSGRISLGAMEVDVLTLGLNGSGKISVAGKAKQLRATVQGSGDLDAERLAVEDAKIVAETSGNITLAVRRAADVTGTGAGDTRIIGKPACTVQALGSGRVICGS